MRALALVLGLALAFPAWGHGTPPIPPPVVKPPVVTPAPQQQPAAGGSNALGWAVFAGIAIYFIAVIIEHQKCVQEKRGCYEHSSPPY